MDGLYVCPKKEKQMEKYFNDAIIGNKEITASLTKQGELIRLFYPNTDYRQFIDFLHMRSKNK